MVTGVTYVNNAEHTVWIIIIIIIQFPREGRILFYSAGRYTEYIVIPRYYFVHGFDTG